MLKDIREDDYIVAIPDGLPRRGALEVTLHDVDTRTACDRREFRISLNAAHLPSPGLQVDRPTRHPRIHSQGCVRLLLASRDARSRHFRGAATLTRMPSPREAPRNTGRRLVHTLRSPDEFTSRSTNGSQAAPPS